MSLALTEPVVAGLVARLTSNLSAAIDQVNAAATDEIKVRYPDPQRILDHLPTLDKFMDFPLIGMGEGPGRFEDDTGHSMTGRYQIAVCVYESDADRQIIATRLRRLRLAVMRCVVEGRVLTSADGSGTAAFGIRPVTLLQGDVVGDTVQHDQPVKSFIGWCGFTVECLTDEDA